MVEAPLRVLPTIPLSKSKGPKTRQVYLGLRDAILSGTLQAGEQLPSTRELADELRVSRTVIVAAYEQLLAEGFAEGRTGSGTYVSQQVAIVRAQTSKSSAKLRLTRYGSGAKEAWTRIGVPYVAGPGKSALRYDFVYGRSDLDSFPFETWQRILLRHARRVSVRGLDYGPASGSVSLREAICAHVARWRAVACEPEQVIIVNGSQQALDLISRVLVERGDPVAIEDPSYQGTQEVLRAAGARVLPIAVDEDGLVPSNIPPVAKLLFATPSHQFPTGAVLSLARRLELLQWAKRRNALIVEDDYDGEFWYEGQPLESLQGLDDEGRVIYVGTFSRTVYSALRIGYMIVPKPLLESFTAAKWLCDRHSPTLEQDTLAEFIASGAYERYLRRVRLRNATRRRVLLDAIRQHLGARVQVSGDRAGAHVVLWLPRGANERSIASAAAENGVGVYELSPYFLRKPTRPGLLLGYSRLRERDIREGIRRLSQVL